MRSFILNILIAAVATVAVSAQADPVVATATGVTIRASQLTPEIRQVMANDDAQIRGVREQLIEEMVNRRVMDVHAAKTGKQISELMAAERAKAPKPTAAMIETTFNENREALSRMTKEEANKRVTDFLSMRAEQESVSAFIKQLRTTYKVSINPDAADPRGRPALEMAATVDGKAITAREFDQFAATETFVTKAEIAIAIISEIEDRLYNELVIKEAASLSIPPDVYIAREITNKLKDYSDEERERLQNAVIEKLFAKYKAKVDHKLPEPPKFNIFTDGSPSDGVATAPATIVMFTDPQCSGCAAFHPMLKSVLKDVGNKARVAIKMFPLEIAHPESLNASKAAMAAHMQGKFFPFIELLYANQKAFDDASLVKYAERAGLNVQQFNQDRASEKVAAAVRRDIADGNSMGIAATPSVYVNGVPLFRLSAEGLKAEVEAAVKK
jgi:protein-disulfide isomerase